MRLSLLSPLLAIGAIVLPLLAMAQGPGQNTNHSWDIAILDNILAEVRPNQKMVMVGDMGFKVTVLKAWRDHLAATSAAGEGPDSAFAGGVVTWTSGTIPYTFDPAVTGPHQQAFLDAAGEWAMFANLHFVPRTSQTNYLLVKNAPDGSGEGGLSSGVGMTGGMQYIQLGPGSWNRGTLCHEIGHVLGLVHEHQRSDRDNYVTILTANISGGGGNGNFTLLPSSQNKGAYDFLSVMHYARNAQSTNPATLDTIVPKTSPIDYSPYLNLMGTQFDRVLSAGDRSGIAMVYGANATATSSVVTNTWDCHDPNTGLTNALVPGLGSLRAAIYYAFDHPGTTITFNISASYLSGGVFTIQPSDYMTRPGPGTIIDGTTQTGGTGNPVIVLDGTLGTSVGNFQHGLRISDSNCVVKGLQFTNFSGSGVYLFGGATNNVIGGTTSAARNVISGNTQCGIYITGTGTTGNVIEGNYIGVARDGATASSNGFSGVEITGGAQGNFVGGLAASGANVVSGNTLDGIRFDGANTNGNVARQNLVGLKANGISALPNGGAGVDIFGGAQTNTIGPRNFISGNTASGIIINASNGTIVQGNYIGLGTDGTTVVANSQAGVYIFAGAQNTTIGGTSLSAGNVISGNTNDGVDLNGVTNTFIQGNYIGLDATGSVAKPNGAGVALFSNASSNTIGGTSPGARNVLSGNTNDGVNINGGSGNTVQGNYIGLDATGLNKIANGGAGISVFGAAVGDTIGGTAVGARNFISGNHNYGVAISGNGTNNNLVQGNTIGLSVVGTTIGNGFQGVALFGGAQSNLIGGSTLGASNAIAGNLAEGVATFNNTTNKNAISQNSIYGNAVRGIGVYTGSNNNQAAPALSSATLSTPANPAGTDIAGSLTSTASTTFRIEFFASPSGGDEGQFFVGSTTATTNGAGSVNVSASLAAAIPAGNVVTATATDPNGNTSQFSSTLTVSATDSDVPKDGIPDNWMIAHFGHATAQAGDKSRATDDADGDGMTNLQEFLAGTDPRNPGSRFAISSIDQSAGNPRINFTGINGNTYRLEFRNDLVIGNWNTLVDQIVSTGALTQIVDPTSTGLGKRFYRLVHEP